MPVGRIWRLPEAPLRRDRRQQPRTRCRADRRQGQGRFLLRRVAEQEGDTPLVFAARINRAPALMHKAGRFPAGMKNGSPPAGEEFHAGRPAVTKRGKNGVFSEEEKTCRARKGGRGTFCAEDPVAGPMLRRRAGCFRWFEDVPFQNGRRVNGPRVSGESLCRGDAGLPYRTRFPGSTRSRGR